MVGTVSRTARVSGVTRNLKEAAGKILARRTGIAYEAGSPGRGVKSLQSPITIQEGVTVYAAGIWDEGRAHYPGRSAVPHLAKSSAGQTGNRLTLCSAEVSRGHTSRTNQPAKGCPSVDPAVSRLWHDQSPHPEAQSRGKCGRTAQVQTPGNQP
jgi:hypothetical protein